ncbi:hypothetical protein B0A50_00320 [Salinomyces thailandicus]|uniref:Uncharacterized protein n=1 Tax=Salinomyces thailandicus TaxID=706561 RepID=A0A4V5N639_9PEZI|nr:hypothetical protein B0A50_00320 [Salinomyces thailandica]
MLSKVKQGISNRTKAAAIRPVESETGLLRRISARGKQTVESERRAQSFEVSRTSVDSNGEDVGEGVLAAAYPQPWRSLTDSTVSTDEILGSAPTTPPPKPASVRSASDFSSAISQTLDCSQPELTPRPPIKALPCPPDGDCKPIALAIPYVELAVNLDRLAVDAGSAPEMWVAIQGVVHSKTLQLDGKHFEHIKHAPDRAATDHSTIIGAITSLRLCFKPAEGCHITDLVGQKTAKNLNVDQSCVLFIKLRVPVLKSRAIYEPDADNALLFDELESIVGTLETDLLNVEARYRHSLLTPDNVINVRHTAKLRRPKIESRWSLLTSPEDLSISDEVHTKLAIHLADHYPPERALGLIDRCLSVERLASEAVRQIRQCVLDDLHKHKHHPAESADKPSVVVTDIDTLDSELGSGTRFEMLPTASDVPLDLPPSKHRAVPMPEALATPPTEVKRRSTSLSALTTLQPHAYTHRTATPKVLSATCLPSLSETPQPLQQPCQSPCQPQPQDSARKLWRHIRHSSLSTQQAADLAASPVHHLEANDTQLRELRRQALANKRSVGAETLRDWKWEERKVQRAEAPWL